MNLVRVAEIKLSLNELEVMTGMNGRMLRNKLASITPEKGEHNSTLYPLKEAIAAIYKKEEPTNLAELKLERQKAEARLSAARAKKVELDIAQTEGTLIPRIEAEKTYLECVANFRIRMLAIPSKAAPVLVAMTDPDQIEQYLNELICEALDALVPADDTRNSESTAEAYN